MVVHVKAETDATVALRHLWEAANLVRGLRQYPLSPSQLEAADTLWNALCAAHPVLDRLAETLSPPEPAAQKEDPAKSL